MFSFFAKRRLEKKRKEEEKKRQEEERKRQEEEEIKRLEEITKRHFEQAHEDVARALHTYLFDHNMIPNPIVDPRDSEEDDGRDYIQTISTFEPQINKKYY